MMHPECGQIQVPVDAEPRESGGGAGSYIGANGYFIAKRSRERLEKNLFILITYVEQDRNVSFPSTLLQKTSLYELFTWKWYLKTHLRAFNEDSEWETKVQLIWE